MCSKCSQRSCGKCRTQTAVPTPPRHPGVWRWIMSSPVNLQNVIRQIWRTQGYKLGYQDYSIIFHYEFLSYEYHVARIQPVRAEKYVRQLSARNRKIQTFSSQFCFNVGHATHIHIICNMILLYIYHTNHVQVMQNKHNM